MYVEENVMDNVVDFVNKIINQSEGDIESQASVLNTFIEYLVGTKTGDDTSVEWVKKVIESLLELQILKEKFGVIDVKALVTVGKTDKKTSSEDKPKLKIKVKEPTPVVIEKHYHHYESSSTSSGCGSSSGGTIRSGC